MKRDSEKGMMGGGKQGKNCRGWQKVDLFRDALLENLQKWMLPFDGELCYARIYERKQCSFHLILATTSKQIFP